MVATANAVQMVRLAAPVLMRAVRLSRLALASRAERSLRSGSDNGRSSEVNMVGNRGARYRLRPTANRLDAERTYMTPCEMAGVAISNSPIEFVATWRNSGPARTTNI